MDILGNGVLNSSSRHPHFLFLINYMPSKMQERGHVAWQATTMFICSKALPKFLEEETHKILMMVVRYTEIQDLPRPRSTEREDKWMD